MILLDTHAWIWSLVDAPELSRPAAAAIRRARTGGGVAIAAISLWEMARLLTSGRLRIAGPLQAALEQATAGVIVQPLTPAIAARAAQLGGDYPPDPADRLIGATALVHGCPLVTRDQKIRASRQVPTVW